MNALTPAAPGPQEAPQEAGLPQARVRRSRLSLIWLIPVVAAVIAGYLAWHTAADRGPMIEITFRTGDGLAAGQTRVRHKAVELGLVEAVRLSPDLGRVVVSVRMSKEATPYLTDQARFWVVRPRLTAGSVSGIETLVSGSYIEMDPGGRDGVAQYAFTGLEQPPGVRSDEPGRTFALKAERLGGLGPGAPVFYRDIVAGEVLGYDLGDGTGPVTLQVFIRAPYDGYVHRGSRFWNASGLSLNVGAEGVRVELASLQAVLNGGVAFETPEAARRTAEAAPGAEFPLYRDQAEARAAGFTTRVPFVSYFETTVRGLAAGAPVEFYGIQVGQVTDVALDFDAAQANARVRVRLEVQPERILDTGEVARTDALEVSHRLIRRGMRAQLRTANYLTGQLVLALDFVPDAPDVQEAELRREGDAIVLPTQAGGLDNILAAVGDIAAKLDRLPLDQIGQNLNETLRQAGGALGSVQELARTANREFTPTLRRLPDLAAGLQDTISRANRTIASFDSSYGRNSTIQRDLGRAIDQFSDAARAIRVLADFLDRHPEALVRGRAGVGATR